MRFFRPLTAVLLSACLFAGCNQSTNPASQPTEQKKVEFPADDLGRPIALKAPAEHVVCVGPGATEVIFAMGQEGKLVGRDQVSDYPEATSKIPVVGDYTGPFVEKTVAVKPDLVIVQGETYDKARAENWQKKIGVPVAILVPTSIEKFAAGIDKIGDWLGAKEKAEAISASFKTVESSSKSAKSPKPIAFFEVERSPIWTAGGGTLIDSVLLRSGFENVAKDVKGYKQINIEYLLTHQPDVYIVATATPDPGKTLAALRKDPVLGKLTCIQKGNLVEMPGDWILRPGPRLQQGIGLLKYAANKAHKPIVVN